MPKVKDLRMTLEPIMWTSGSKTARTNCSGSAAANTTNEFLNRAQFVSESIRMFHSGHVFGNTIVPIFQPATAEIIDDVNITENEITVTEFIKMLIPIKMIKRRAFGPNKTRLAARIAKKYVTYCIAMRNSITVRSRINLFVQW